MNPFGRANNECSSAAQRADLKRSARAPYSQTRIKSVYFTLQGTKRRIGLGSKGILHSRLEVQKSLKAYETTPFSHDVASNALRAKTRSARENLEGNGTFYLPSFLNKSSIIVINSLKTERRNDAYRIA